MVENHASVMHNYFCRIWHKIYRNCIMNIGKFRYFIIKVQKINVLFWK